MRWPWSKKTKKVEEPKRVWTDRDVAVDPNATVIREGDSGFAMLNEAIKRGGAISGQRRDDGTWDITHH